MKTTKKRSQKIRGITSKPEFSTIILFVVMLILISILQDGFYKKSTILNNINAFTPLILMAAGQAVVLISGGLDLSAGTSMALMLCVMTKLMNPEQPITGLFAIVVCIGVVIIVGVVNGLCVGYLRIPAVIATFATSYIWLGVALFITPTPGGKIVKWFKLFYNWNAIDGMPAGLKAFSSYVSPAILLIVICVITWLVIKKMPTGRYIYAIGSHNDNAFFSGINTTFVQVKAYIINAFFLMLCALYFAGQNEAGSANIGDTMTLQSIAASVVGGVSITGGKGNVFMAMIGAVIMSLIGRIIYYANVSSSYQSLINGIIIILAISLSAFYDYFNHKQLLKGGKDGE